MNLAPLRDILHREIHRTGKSPHLDTAAERARRLQVYIGQHRRNERTVEMMTMAHMAAIIPHIGRRPARDLKPSIRQRYWDMQHIDYIPRPTAKGCAA